MGEEISPVRVLMRDGKWLVPETERPVVAPAPTDEQVEQDQAESIGYFKRKR